MSKILWNSLILWAILSLLLNSSHANRNQIKGSFKKFILDESDKISVQDAQEIINIVYNLYNNEIHLSKVMSNKLKVFYGMTSGEVELRQTTCTWDESLFDECQFKTNYHRMDDIENRIEYLKLNSRRNTCSKFQSELSKCPFSEQPDQQKREKCFFIISGIPFSVKILSIKFNCQSV